MLIIFNLFLIIKWSATTSQRNHPKKKYHLDINDNQIPICIFKLQCTFIANWIDYQFQRLTSNFQTKIKRTKITIGLCWTVRKPKEKRVSIYVLYSRMCIMDCTQQCSFHVSRFHVTFFSSLNIWVWFYYKKDEKKKRTHTPKQ